MYSWLLHIKSSLDCILAKNYTFGNFVDCYAVAVKKDSSDYAPSRFKSSFGSDPTRKYFKYNYCTKNLTRNSKSCKMNSSHKINSNGL